MYSLKGQKGEVSLVPEVSWYSCLESVQVLRKKKSITGQQGVPEATNETYESWYVSFFFPVYAKLWRRGGISKDCILLIFFVNSCFCVPVLSSIFCLFSSFIPQLFPLSFAFLFFSPLLSFSSLPKLFLLYQLFFLFFSTPSLLFSVSFFSFSMFSFFPLSNLSSLVYQLFLLSSINAFFSSSILLSLLMFYFSFAKSFFFLLPTLSFLLYQIFLLTFANYFFSPSPHFSSLLC